jgi:hypothetical protein
MATVLKYVLTVSRMTVQHVLLQTPLGIRIVVNVQLASLLLYSSINKKLFPTDSGTDSKAPPLHMGWMILPKHFLRLKTVQKARIRSPL